MSRSARSWIARWWPLPFGVGLVAYAPLQPYPTLVQGHVLAYGMFGVAGILLVATALHPVRPLRIAALGFSAAAMFGRAMIWALSGYEWRTVLVGVLVWCLFAYVVTVLMLMTEFALGPSGRSWQGG